ncbi:MAG TPA: FKBP-type peptidyl-prolyl cis-trans isomerase [Ignavibacteriaceae bacterium]
MKSILIALFSVVFIFGCSNNPDSVTLKSGLKYNDIKVGTGIEAKNGDLVEIHFKGWIVKDSSNLFSDWSVDSTKKADLIADSYAMNQPMKFVLGTESFIKGSEEGIVGMKAGGQRASVIPSNLAYGPQGMGPIPPNTNIKVLIELVSAKEAVVAKMWDVDSTLFKTTASGLKYAIIQQGEGELVGKEKQVTVHYSGFLLDGTKFDSSVERDEPFTFVAGVGQVIPGWDEGVQLMKKGSKARLIIPSNLAYGERDLGKIPPNSTLIFDVEVLDVK